MNSGVAIAVVGDYEAQRPSHKATNEALHHGAATLVLGVSTEWIPTQTLESDRARIKSLGYDGIFCAPGGPYRSMNGALEAIRFARERGWPFLGT